MQRRTDTEPPTGSAPDKGSILWGFLLYLAILAANAVLGTQIYAVINAFGMGYSRDALYLSALPVALFVGALVFLLAKGKTRTALGMAVPFLITAVLVGFGLVATLHKLASLGIR